MGGIAFETPENLPESKRFLPSHQKETWFLKNRAIHHLSKYDGDVIPDLREEEIKSKSKANGVAKALVCIQALWFIAQSSTRRKWKNILSNLPTSDKEAILTVPCSRTTYSNKFARA